MRVVIQIPAAHFEPSLAVRVAALPRKVPGAELVEWLLVMPASGGEGQRFAETHGIDHFVRVPEGASENVLFSAALGASLDVGADLIVHAELLNGASADDIPGLLLPLIRGEADVTIAEHREGERGRLPRIVSRFADRLLSAVSNSPVRDAASPLRAFNRDAANRLKGYGGESYRFENILEASHKAMVIAFVPVDTKALAARPRKVVSQVFSAVFRCYLLVRPLRIFTAMATITLLLSLAFRSGYFGVMLSGLFFIAGIFAEMLALQRLHTEDLEARVQRVCDILESHDPLWSGEPSHSEYFGKPNAPPEIH